MPMKTFARKTLLRQDWFGIDSVQGVLELATWYERGKHVTFIMNEEDLEDPKSFYSTLTRMQKEGYVDLSWEPYPDKQGHVRLAGIALTTNGYKLLDELQQKSSWGLLKVRVAQLFWVVVASIATTLITLYFRDAGK